MRFTDAAYECAYRAARDAINRGVHADELRAAMAEAWQDVLRERMRYDVDTWSAK